MIKGFWKISFSKLVPSFLKSDVKHPPKSKNFEIFPTSNSNNSKTKKSFEILKTPLNPACGDEHIGFFSFFLGPFPDLEKTVGSLNPVHFSRELLVKTNIFHPWNIDHKRKACINTVLLLYNAANWNAL
jgi:hypothetical protein